MCQYNVDALLRALHITVIVKFFVALQQKKTLHILMESKMLG